ncbi:MAG: hypothetical protein A2287_08465 [Candidatus Melainabacteria bacterium RIFOXYA12_FULL_32_12]|nr:MAG: hypothetical protein A2255_00910 [Candidatus Melainabacteria bacterium RIFOXYA2_FULL_32_9]OGI24869.1 MAG: hypothetical protein A2287_08465 [Candidatus Melainabacteria bacterium RIFOXYA12_FULL_32_12]
MDFNTPDEININNEINNYEQSQAKEAFPQYLCKTCGRCCKSITTSFTYDELKEMSDKGLEEARVFIEIFKPYSSIEEARKIVPEQVEQVLSILEDDKDFDINKVTFYYCPHITDDGKCSIYETRPNCCRRAPNHGWSVMPPGCGFEGWQFEQREKHKKMVRSVKEYLYMIESLSKDGKVPGKEMTVEELRKNIEEKIKPWEKFGSMFW